MDNIKNPTTIKILGVGGAGCNAVQYLARQSFEGLSYAVLNTDAQVLARSSVETKLILGEKSMRGIGAGGDPKRGRLAAQEDSARLAALCEGADVVFIVAGLGGGTGTGASPVVARAAKEKGALVLGIVFLPFDFEGARRQEIAAQGCEELHSVADGIICLPNQKIFKLVDEKTSVIEGFTIINDLVAQGIGGIYRLLSRTGLINVDFADLCAAVHSSTSLATAEGKGENRAREVLDKLIGHPLIDGGQVLAESASLLVSITGGPDLTMIEINRIMESIHRQAEHAHIIMGASVEEDWKERVAVTLVASRRSGRPERAREFGNGSGQNSEPASPTSGSAPELESQLVSPDDSHRPASRFVPPPPVLTPERADQILTQQAGRRHPAKRDSRLRQGQLPLEIISKGRFEKSEPTIHQGQDLDVPTYIRRGVALN